MEDECNELRDRAKQASEEREGLADEVETLRRALDDERIGEIGLDSVERRSLGSENRALDDDIEMFSNAPGLSLPALWRKRQRSVLEANERTRLEIELLRERLAHTEARLTEGKAPLMAEVRSLREARDESLDALRLSQELWEAERNGLLNRWRSWRYAFDF